jgi:glycosyltransferase involved in cell wall biosynthesis
MAVPMTQGATTGTWPRISVITASFNQAWALERTLRSVLDQNYPNLEYLVLDGGSTDGSAAILERYRDRLAYVSCGPDGGQAQALAAGSARATGDILCWLNSDDVLLPGSLMGVAEAFRAGAPWVIGWNQIIDADDRVLMKRPTLPVTVSEVLAFRYILPQEAIFVSRELYLRSGGFDARYHYAMDAHLWMRLFGLAQPVWLHRYLAAFRVHPQQKSSRMDRYWEEFVQADAELTGWRTAHGLARLEPVGQWNRMTFRARKILYCLVHAGIGNAWDIYRFCKIHRPQ